jgi:hypothetical protein
MYKTIQIKKESWKILKKLLLELDMISMYEIIEFLIDFYNKKK